MRGRPPLFGDALDERAKVGAQRQQVPPQLVAGTRQKLSAVKREREREVRCARKGQDAKQQIGQSSINQVVQTKIFHISSSIHGETYRVESSTRENFVLRG